MHPLTVIVKFALVITILAAGLAYGQNYPSKGIRIVTSAPGGGNDYSARIIAQAISGALGQPVIVENRGGANNVNAVETVTHAQPDGYTLLYQDNGLWTFPFFQSGPYSILKDLSPITLTVRTPTILVVHPSLPVKSVKELIALAKAKPGDLNYSSGATGSAIHIAPELFKAMAGINMVRITYKGGAAAMTDLIGGQVQVMFPVVSSGLPLVKSGRLRALAVTSAEPSPLVPDLPTLSQSGLPGFNVVTTQGLLAPARTPSAVIARLHQEVTRALNRPEVKEKFFTAGFETVGNTPEQFTAYIRADMAAVEKLIKQTGIRD